jgi:spore coat polysaccharide biosynthesis predicted glycosyltransferase SpsG
MTHLTIRADGGPEIGYGHLIRSNALGEKILSRDYAITVTTTTPQAARSIFPDTVKIAQLPSRGDPDPFVDWLDANKPDAVFTDSYPIDTEYQRTVRDRVPLAVLQDDDRHTVCADLFVNGNLYAPDLDYEFVGQKPKTSLGTDYVLLRSEIRDRAKDEPPWREQPERALVTMGGSDIADLMPTVIHAFDGFDIHVDAIVGPGFSEAQEQSIRAAAKEISVNVSVVRDPDDLVERMFQADFAVSTSSSTTYELLALGTPIVSVPVANNQELVAQSLRERDAARVLERGANKTAFQSSIEAYLTNKTLRKAHRELGRKLVDSKGTIRVANEVASIV